MKTFELSSFDFPEALRKVYPNSIACGDSEKG
jgi:hypothetical protein